MAYTSFSGFNKKNWGTPSDIKAFQRYSGITPTGYAGKQTSTALNNYFAAQTPLPPLVQNQQVASPAVVNESVPVATAMNSLPQYNYLEGTAGTLANDVNTYNYLKDNGFTGEANSYMNAMQNPPVSDMDKYTQTLKDIASANKAPEWVSGLQGAAAGVSALSGLYGMYQANKNYNLQKQAQVAQLAQARASEANRSAIAKSFGSTYIPAQF